MAAYIHELSDWPNFQWDSKALAEPLASVRLQQGRLIGRMEGLGFPQRSEALLTTLTEDVVKSSEIEGEILDRDQVRSSIARRLGIDIGALAPADRDVEGVVEMMLDATQNYDRAADRGAAVRLARGAVPDRAQRHARITVGAWRDDATGPMQVVSGPIGSERVHYEAPAAPLLTNEMKDFLDVVRRRRTTPTRFSRPASRICGSSPSTRSMTATAASRAPSPTWRSRARRSSPQRFYSMSAQIRQERNAYYDILEATQKGELDITPWLSWFLGCLERAFDGAENILAGVLQKARLLEDARQRSASMTVSATC